MPDPEGRDAPPEPSSTALVAVTGSSMSPSIVPGDTVVVDVSGSRRPRPGEVVLIGHEPGPPVVHRVVAARLSAGDWRFVTAGDESGRLDGVIGSARVRGRAVCIMRQGETIDVPAHALPWRARFRARVRLLAASPTPCGRAVGALVRFTSAPRAWLRRR